MPRSLTLGIFFATALTAAVVDNPVILSILPYISVLLTLWSVF